MPVVKNFGINNTIVGRMHQKHICWMRIDEILRRVQQKTFEFLSTRLDAQALLFTKQEIQNKINVIMDQKASTLAEYKTAIESIPQTVNIDADYTQSQKRLQKILDDQDYFEALKLLNDKGLLSHSGLPNEFGWKKDCYIDYVLRLLNSSKAAEELVPVFKKVCSK